MDAKRMDARLFSGEPRVLISRDALLHNASLIRRSVGKGVKVCAILKADAYGHGAAIVADTLSNFSTAQFEAPLVDALAVASIDEAERLPATILPVLILRPVENCFMGRQRSRIEQAVRKNWILTLCSAAAAQDVARIAASINRRAQVQVMLDTGMTRSGVLPEELAHVLETVQAHPTLRLISVMTHFASAEDLESGATQDQTRTLLAAIEPVRPLLTATGAGNITIHAANSAALFLSPQTHFDMVRPGLALYGLDPTLAPTAERLLKPALRWTAPLIQIHTAAAGTLVGYGQTWRAPQESRIGLIPVGYADGYSRSLSNQGMMMIHGQPCPVVGRVSMDLTTVDLTALPHAVVGDEVTILDSDPLSPASVYQIARLTGTIPYEILCGIGPRIHRVATEGARRTMGNESVMNDESINHDE